MGKSEDDNSKASPKDVFLHLLSIGTLYFSAGAFLGLVFVLINVGFPDPLNQYYDPSRALQWSMSLLVVLFPVYLWTVRTLHKEMLDNPEKREQKIRKWLLYFTMFAAAALILGDLVVLLNRFLGGEFTIRFILKAIAVFFVAGSVLGYYRYEVHEGVKEIIKYSKKLAWIVGLIVLSVVVLGFVVGGTPGEQQARKFDEQRVQNLSAIQSHIVSYWQAKDGIPESLDEIVALSGTDVLLDPQTSEPYEYEKLGELSFELCAIFKTATDASSPGAAVPRLHPREAGISYDWTHKEGRQCFERTIDPDFFEKS